MNGPLRHVAVACMVLFGLLLVNATYLQAVRAENLRERPSNVRSLYQQYERQRGPIVVDGTRIAYSTATDDDALKYLRRYRYGPLYAHATGYYSLFGATAIEREKNEVLSGTAERFFMRRVRSLASGTETQGGSVVLTLDSAAQRAARSGLKGQPGAAVALDPRTGDILAMASTPSYDPNRLAAHDSDKVQNAYDKLDSADGKPLLNRATSEVYPPGSTFKVITAAAALSSESTDYTPASTLPAPKVLDLPLSTSTVQNYAGESCGGGGSLTLAQALRISCNTAFAKLGMQLGDDVLRRQAQKFGFGDTVEMPMETEPSVFPSEVNEPQTAFSAIGQFDVRATPIQMAMVAAGVANNGMVMNPHLINEIKAPDLETVETVRPQEYGRAMPPKAANALAGMMTGVVESGTGTSAQIPGVTVAGKTGTAEPKPEDAWFIGFAPAQNPRVAVAVVVPDSGSTGGSVAAPVARDMMEAVLRR